MQPAKLHFSPHEMNLVTDAGWILTKNEILNKIKKVLGEVHQSQKNILTTSTTTLPEKVLATTPKISKGENYKGLPHLVLDFPRLFERGNIFAIRSLFWWGRTLSTTLHLSGRWQQKFSESIFSNYNFLAENKFVIATGAHEWVHDVTSEDYTPVAQLSYSEFEELITKKDFVKIALYSPISELNSANEVWENHFKSITSLLTDYTSRG